MAKQDFYDRQYAQMDEKMWNWREMGGAAKARNVVMIVGDLPVKSIVDVGCGSGSVLAHLAKIGFGEHYYALDISDEAIHIVKSRSDIPNLVEAKVFDGLHIPYDNYQFDLCMLSHVIEHLVNPVPILQEAARVARYVVVEVPLEDNLYTHLKVRLLRSRYREALGHVQWFNQSNFRYLLEHTCGLKIMDIRMVYVPDELYYFRKQGISHKLAFLMLAIRKALRALSNDLYSRLLTDHCIALVSSSGKPEHKR